MNPDVSGVLAFSDLFRAFLLYNFSLFHVKQGKAETARSAPNKFVRGRSKKPLLFFAEGTKISRS